MVNSFIFGRLTGIEASLRRPLDFSRTARKGSAT